MSQLPRRSIFRVLSRLRTHARPHEPLSAVTKRVFALSFTSEFIAIYPFYVIMFGERGHVSAAGVGLLLGIWMVVSVLAEVPTGIIADKMSKKWSLVLGRILQLLTFVIWLAMPNFTGYLIGFIIWGVGEAFLSGAFQAYLYESLDERNKQAFGRIYSRSSAFTMMAYAAGSLLAFAVGPQYNALLILSIAVSAVSLVLTLSLPATKSQVDVEVRPKVLRTAVRAIRHNPFLWRLFVAAVIVQGLMSMLGEYMPAYYQQVGLPTQWIALVMSIGSVTAALLYWWMHHVERQLARYRAHITVACTALFVVSFWGGPIVAVLGMFVLTRVLRLMTVANESVMQHHAPSEARATVGSLYSFVGKLLSAGIVALVGAFAVGGSIVVPIRWSVIGASVIFCVIVWYFARQPKQQL